MNDFVKPDKLYAIARYPGRYYHSESAVKGVLTRLRKWKSTWNESRMTVMVADVVNWREVEV